MSRSRSTRRSFLRSVGAAAALLPFYKLLEDDAVRAEGMPTPLKFVGVGAFHGALPMFYSRKAGETDTSFDISYADCGLKPFDDPARYGKSFKDRVAIFEGFDYGVGQTSPDGNSVSFHGAMGLFLTGSAASASFGNGSYELQNESLDQYLAAKYGGATPFRSIELATEADFGDITTSWAISFGAGGQLLGRLTDPEEIWDKFFTALVAQQDPEQAAKLARQRKIGHSMFDFMLADIQRLNQRVPSAQRAKLDQHLTVMRDLEKRLDEFGTGDACMIPTRHPKSGNANPADDYIVSNFWNGGSPYFDKIADYQIELLAEILKCDLCRFATIVLPNTAGEGQNPGTVTSFDTGEEVASATGTDLTIPMDFHNEIAHVVNSESDVAQQRASASMNRYYFGKVASLMQRLDAGGALDSTLILVGNEGGDGNGHWIGQVPIVLAGGANGAFKGGKRIVAPGRTAVAGQRCTGGPEWTSHNPILVAVANLFGEDLDHYGTHDDPAMTAGIPGLLG
ncbi:MAG: DUF1552 domain-containing protein [Polyangiaceae bacterium]